MPLTSFGSILTFAEDLEKQDMVFYADLAENQNAGRCAALAEDFAKEGKKNIKVIQRTRRENVTEMILEPIHGFERSPYCMDSVDAQILDEADAEKAITAIEQRFVTYYNDAAVKIKALPEVANALKMLAKKHTKHLKKI